MGDGKVNRFAAQIVFVKEGLHGEGHFVPPDRADNDDFVILRHVLNALQELWLYIFPLLALQNMFLADTRENAERAYNLFVETYELKYPKAVECLKKDHDDLFRFYDFPAEHWVHIRTSNPIESMFATVRLRHRSTKGNGSSTATLTMVFKLCKEAEKNWRRLKGFEKLRLVQQDMIFVDGLLAA